MAESKPLWQSIAEYDYEAARAARAAEQKELVDSMNAHARHALEERESS